MTSEALRPENQSSKSRASLSYKVLPDFLPDLKRLPVEGEVFKSEIRAEQKLPNETIVFVHHFGGSKQTLMKHVRLVNELGYDAVVFNLLYHNARTPMQTLPITADLKFGARFVWTEQIEAVLNAVPGRKIVFSFSMPSNSAFEAISRRGAEDISAWICDGGPFLQIFRCSWNLYTLEYKIPSKIVRAAFTAASVGLFGGKFERTLNSSFAKLPAGFPVLVLHGAQDAIVPVEATDDFFAHSRNVEIEKVMFAEAGHLDSYRMHAMEYRTRLREFLDKTHAKQN